MKLRKKLIEIALPLEAVNKACSREKSIRHGHPSTLHLWWARRPLASARAVIFSQLVDDPSSYTDELLKDTKLRRTAEKLLKDKLSAWQENRNAYKKGKELGVEVPEPGPQPQLETIIADLERQRLFTLIEKLVQWENTNNEEVLQEAHTEILNSWKRTCSDNTGHPQAAELFNPIKLPAFHDPFAGGGALPLEAQRLGLEAHASDLNPVAVLINKAMIEIPPKFAGLPPVNPEYRAKTQNEKDITQWKGAQGLAEDVRYYGKWMRDEAEKRIGHLYPKIEITEAMVQERPDLKKYKGKKLTVIVWIWARTVKSPNPAFANVEVPLASTFMLSTKARKEAYVEPMVEVDGYRFTVKVGKPKDAEGAKNGTKLSRGANFKCVMSGTPIAPQYIKDEGKAGRMGARLMAIVAEGDRGRTYLSPTPEMEAVALSAQPTWKPETPLPADMRSHWTPPYGLTTYGDLFTQRQLVALTTFSDLIPEAIDKIKKDALNLALEHDNTSLCDDGKGIKAYSEAVGVYLSIALSRTTNTINSLAVWSQSREQSVNLFSRQAIPMAWDFPEVNPFGGAAGDITTTICSIVRTILSSIDFKAYASQSDAQNQNISKNKVIATDPPYYDNIGYADLSDFFYVWLRRSLRTIYPAIFSTISVPKDEELVATPYRHGSKENAERFFLTGMTQAMHNLAEQAHAAFPVTIYYAFKQSESDDAEGTTNTGWDTFLAAVIEAGFAISGTWPIRTERDQGVKTGKNVLASSIVLVCRKRPETAPITSRREFVNMLKTELPEALAHLQEGNIAPVDLAQAAIGPGMAVYTRFSKVLDAEGNAITVREALRLINQILDETLSSQEGEFDADTRWALTWFDQKGFEEGDFGIAEQLSKSKNTSIQGLVDAGILHSKAGKVRLLKPIELPADWNPDTDNRLTVWEMLHHLIRLLTAKGETAAAELFLRLGVKADAARELCYRLYLICERKNRTDEALAYNALVQSWSEVNLLSQTVVKASVRKKPEQTELF